MQRHGDDADFQQVILMSDPLSCNLWSFHAVEPGSLAEGAGIKRKALTELPTPQPASLAASYLATDEGAKRRMSPEPEAIQVHRSICPCR